MNSSSVRLGYPPWGRDEARSLQRILPVQDHFPDISDSGPTQSINFKLNFMGGGGVKLQILTHLVADQLYVICPCKRVGFYLVHLLLKV